MTPHEKHRTMRGTEPQIGHSRRRWPRYVKWQPHFQIPMSEIAAPQLPQRTSGVYAILQNCNRPIIRMIEEEGRAVVLAANKWDIAGKESEALTRITDRLQTSLTQLQGVSLTPVSAKTGKGLDKLMIAEARAGSVAEDHESVCEWRVGMCPP